MKKRSDSNESKGADEGTTSTSRRRLLTALTAGGAAIVAAPAEWTKPALKSVMLPAHAQTSPNGGCVISIAGAGVDTGGLSMSITAQADADCGSTASVEVRDSDGSLLISCSNNTVPFGNGKVSWSCEGNRELSGGSAGGLITFDVTFSNGCTCRAIDDAN